jgi:LacI family transcriptional regulator
VSRVINNYSNVPPATREKVMKVIREHNYVPNLSAQVLAGKKTKTLGLFMIEAGNVSGDSITNLMIASIVESASSQGYYVLTYILQDTREVEHVQRVREVFFQQRIDGGIFIGAANHEPLIEELIAEGFVVGIVDHDLPGHHEPNRIVINYDNALGVATAVDYLVRLGHTKIGIINGDMKRYAGPSKFAAFTEAMKQHGIPVRNEWVISGGFHQDNGSQAIKTLLKSVKELPTALVAANDSVAFGAIQALFEQGIKVPEDLSVIGFDDHVLSSLFQPALTTIRVDFRAMMERLTATLIETMEHTAEHASAAVRDLESTRMTVGTHLVVRASCQAISF